jgi:hypothetical protein
MNTESRECQTVQELTLWFIDQLDQSNVRFEDEPVSYDGNTPYDVQFYKLQTEAARYWQDRYGFVPTPGQLMKGFFDAEFARSRRLRLANRSWLERLQDWYAASIASSPNRTRAGGFRA